MSRSAQSHKPKVLLERDLQNPRFDAGTLFEVLDDDPYETKVKVQSLDPGDSTVILCRRSYLRELTPLEALVLLPVKPVRNRLKIYRDEEWLKEIPVISENKRVIVKDKFEGIVKFKGVVREYGPGIRFIVEIQVTGVIIFPFYFLSNVHCHIEGNAQFHRYCVCRSKRLCEVAPEES